MQVRADLFIVALTLPHRPPILLSILLHLEMQVVCQSGFLDPKCYSPIPQNHQSTRLNLSLVNLSSLSHIFQSL